MKSRILDDWSDDQAIVHFIPDDRDFDHADPAGGEHVEQAQVYLPNMTPCPTYAAAIWFFRTLSAPGEPPAEFWPLPIIDINKQPRVLVHRILNGTPGEEQICNILVIPGPWPVILGATANDGDDVPVVFYGSDNFSVPSPVLARYQIDGNGPELTAGSPALAVARFEFGAVADHTDTIRWHIVPAGAGSGGGAPQTFALFAPATYAEAVAAGYSFT